MGLKRQKRGKKHPETIINSILAASLKFLVKKCFFVVADKKKNGRQTLFKCGRACPAIAYNKVK